MTITFGSTTRRTLLRGALGVALVSALGACAIDATDEERGAVTSGTGVAGAAFTPAQARWIAFIGDDVVARLGGSTEERARAAAVVTWWALKEGVLDVAPNPWRHNLCTRGGGDVELDDLGVCAGPAWQVGMSGIQVGNVSTEQVEGAAARLYPGEGLPALLARIAGAAGVSADAASRIAGSTGDLRKAWLLRDPAIGITLQRALVESECLQQALPWCFGSWDQARAFASSSGRIREVVSDLEARFTSGATGSGAPVPPTTAPPSSPATTCPLGAGLYCGGNHVNGDPGTLYRCRASGLIPIERCAKGCEWMPDGKNDRCAR